MITVNRRNGYTGKTLRTSGGSLPIKVPRDKEVTFEPVLVKKESRDFHL